jgi:aminoglycoside phosphotransferase (APT) family kinase protein
MHDTSSEWSTALTQGSPSAAEVASHALSPENPDIQEYITLIHGDVKSENLFSTSDGKSVAFYDFQYVGLGLGVCDLAKLFTCSVPTRMLPPSKGMGAIEEKLLRHYHDRLLRKSGRRYPWELFVEHWDTALVDWLRFQASWGFWGNTAWLEERGRGILSKRT